MGKNIIVSDFSSEMKPRYLDYAMNVITDRALPDGGECIVTGKQIGRAHV